MPCTQLLVLIHEEARRKLGLVPGSAGSPALLPQGGGGVGSVLSTPLVGPVGSGRYVVGGGTPGLMSHPELRQRLPSDGGASTPSVKMSPIQTSRSGAPAAPHLSLADEDSKGGGTDSSSSSTNSAALKHIGRAVVGVRGEGWSPPAHVPHSGVSRQRGGGGAWALEWSGCGKCGQGGAWPLC
jgi:hypothetical protein